MKYSLYHGNSPFLSLRATHNALEELKANMPETTIKIINADTLDPSLFADSLMSAGLFTSQRILLIKRLYKNKNKDKLLEFTIDYLSNNTSGDTILIWEDQKIRSTTKYFKFFKENSAVDEFNTLNKRTFDTWLKQELSENSLDLDISTRKILAENTNYDPERCSNEIKKLKLSGEEITKELLEQLTTNTLEADIWKLIDSINHQNKSESLSIMERLLSQSNDPHYILAMLARNLRLLTLTKHLTDQGKAYKEIASILRVPPFTVPSMIKASQNHTNEKIKKLYEKFTNLDLQMKTGKIDGNLGLTLLCTYI